MYIAVGGVGVDHALDFFHLHERVRTAKKI